jgi:hypothetical protein
MKKYVQMIILLLILPFVYSCLMDGNRVEELEGYTGDNPNQISVIGFMCNKGIVVEIQKALAPYSSEDTITKIPDVVVELLNEENNNSVILNSYTDKIFYTPNNFSLKSGINYYLKIIAPEYKEVTTVPQQILPPFQIDSIQINDKHIKTYLEFDLDTIQEDLFGVKTFYNGQLNYRKNRFSYQRKRKGEFYHELLFNNDLFFFDFPYFDFSDLIYTNDTIEYEGEVYPIQERVDSAYFQVFCFDSIVSSFQKEQYNYQYSNQPYFSIISKTPSNIINGVGLFVSSWMATKTMYFVI